MKNSKKRKTSKTAETVEAVPKKELSIAELKAKEQVKTPIILEFFSLPRQVFEMTNIPEDELNIRDLILQGLLPLIDKDKYTVEPHFNVDPVWTDHMPVSIRVLVRITCPFSVNVPGIQASAAGIIAQFCKRRWLIVEGESNPLYEKYKDVGPDVTLRFIAGEPGHPNSFFH